MTVLRGAILIKDTFTENYLTQDTIMKKLYGIFLLCYACLLAYVLIDLGKASSTQSLHRPRRFLSFRNITHFFLRVNFKANMVPWNQIFAQAVGFRINWDDPPDSFHAYHHLNRRALYSHLELLLDRNGLNGFHCVRRAFCDMDAISETNAMYHRILQIVFRNQSSTTAKWHEVSRDDCRLSLARCPFSVLDVVRYTDVL